jgi:hypothetical protein
MSVTRHRNATIRPTQFLVDGQILSITVDANNYLFSLQLGMDLFRTVTT